MICHTYTMGQAEYEERLTGLLTYVALNGAHFVTPATAKRAFDGLRLGASDA